MQRYSDHRRQDWKLDEIDCREGVQQIRREKIKYVYYAESVQNKKYMLEACNAHIEAES